MGVVEAVGVRITSAVGSVILEISSELRWVASDVSSGCCARSDSSRLMASRFFCTGL